MTQKWPALPRDAYSPLGAFTVQEAPQIDNAYGSVDYVKRAITIAPGMLPATQWHTLAHEMMHVMLHESGIEELLDEPHQEMVCTAFGQYLAGAIGAGFLTVRK
jgi:hypothetical protein